jgi:nitroimidazol reductase NimA-like FMN-containing flavoprotein (pyridoxamine 5'-phosphate oxidase superfamily)
MGGSVPDQELAARLGETLVLGEDAERTARRVLDEARVGFLGTHDADGPYVLPVSFAYDGEVVHLHGGPGKKAAALASDARACLAVGDDPKLILADNPCSDNFGYRTVLVYGHVVQVTDTAAKEAGLRAIIAKYHPEKAGAPLRPETLAKTLVYRMEIRAMTYRQYPDN